MRRTVFTIMSLVMIGSLVLASFTPAAAQRPAPSTTTEPLLVDNFDYGSTPGDLTAVSSWTAHSVAGTGPVQYVTTGLSMAGYGSSGVGGAATISTSGSEDVNRSFTNQTSGTVYFAALVNVSTAGSGAYFLHLKDSGTFNFRARVFAKNEAGVLRFGLGDTSTASYATADFSYNTTYLIVVKFNATTGDTALYVLNSGSATEPTTPLLSTTGTAQAVEGIAIRQASGGPSATIDGIRVANTWEDVIGYSGGGGGSFTIAKSAPASVEVSEAFIYTLVATNGTGAVRSNVVITDSLPLSVTVGTISDGGLATGHVVSW